MAQTVRIYTHMQLDKEQQRAVELCVDRTKRLVAVTGEAGTGKTTIIKNACDELSSKGVSFALAAPTGKAARRIREATGYHASTLHKLLEYNRPDFDDDTGEPTSVSGPNRTRSNPLEQQVIIVDEYAMVATALHRNLVSAITSTTCLRVFGDVRQLPPIENNDLADPTSPFTRCLAMPNSVHLQHLPSSGRQRHHRGSTSHQQGSVLRLQWRREVTSPRCCPVCILQHARYK